MPNAAPSVSRSPADQVEDMVSAWRAEHMHAAWTKAVLLSVALWSRPLQN